MLELLPWQQHQWQQLDSAISAGKLHHALLLTGPAGIGLRQFANALAARLLCHNPGNDFMCGECKSCILFKAGNHPDIMLLEPEEAGKQLKVELVRDLVEFMHHTSQYGRKKLAIIDPADAMNRSSANSLLKTLEEPPADTLIILLSHQPSRLPVTVRSRCQRINFPPSYTEQTLAWLESNIDEHPLDARELLEIAHGAPLQALDLLEHDHVGKRTSLLQDLAEIRAGNADVVKIAERWQVSGSNEVLSWLLSIAHQLIRVKLDTADHLSGGAEAIPYFQVLTNELDLKQLVMCYDETLKHYQASTGPYNLNQQGVLEDLIIYWQSVDRNFEENRV